VIVGMFAAVSLVTLGLLFTESASLQRVLFEAVSACGTVGLSTGLTDELTIPGRVIIILAMFVGRLGPLTVLVALAGRTSSARYEYPEEQPIIG
jgi:Trk-type K+ transport system membrane component